MCADFAVDDGAKAWDDDAAAIARDDTAVPQPPRLLWRVAQAVLPRRFCCVLEEVDRWRVLDAGGDWSVEEKRRLLLEWLRARHDFRHRPGSVNRGANVRICRDRVLFSSLEELAAKSIEQLGRGLSVKFVPKAEASVEGFPPDESEIGDDLGGLTTEWLYLLGEAMGAADGPALNPLFAQCEGEGGARELMLRPWPELLVNVKPKAHSRAADQRVIAEQMLMFGAGETDPRAEGGGSPIEEAEPPEAAAAGGGGGASEGGAQQPAIVQPEPEPAHAHQAAATDSDRPRIRRVSHHVFRWMIDQDPANGGLAIIDPANGVRLRDPRLTFEPEESLDITGEAAPPPAAPALFAAGRALGLALLHAQPLGLRFAPALLRILTNEPLRPADVKRMDPTFYSNCLERAARPGGVAALAELWCSDAVLFLSGGVDGEPLCDGGGSRVVTEENKAEWLRLMAEHRVCGSIRHELSLLREGFEEVVPLRALMEFKVSAEDLGSMIRGSNASIDVSDWRSHTEVSDDLWNTVQGRKLVRWFWEIVTEMSQPQRRLLLQFSTGGAYLAGLGLGSLATPAGMRQPFHLSLQLGDGHLPTASTCFNKLRLPNDCSDKDELRRRINKAIEQGGGFGLV